MHWHDRELVERIKLDGETWYCCNDIPGPSREKVEAYEKRERLQYLAYGCNEDYARFIPTLAKAGLKPSKREAKAREWAVWERIDQLTNEANPQRITIAHAFEVYTKLQMPKPLTHYHSFYKKLSDFRRNPAAAFVDGRTGKTSPNRKKTERHEQILEELYAKPNKYKGPYIAAEANKMFREEGLAELEYETIKKILADPALKARTYESRHGAKAHSDHHVTYIKFEKPSAVGARAEMDGVKLPFKVLDSNGKIVRPWMFAIIDTHSGKITGWSLGLSESRWLVLQAFKSQAQNGWFPSEIWADNFSGKDTPEFTDVKEKVLARGTQIKYARVGKGQDKPFIERFFNTFQDRFCREYRDWVGMGVRSKNMDDRANPEAYRAYIKEHGYPTMEGVRQRVSDMLEKYHNTSFKGKPTANERFAACREAEVIPVAEAEIPYLFWHKTEVKVIRGKLTIQVNKQEYTYHLPAEYNGQRLVVRYEPEDLSEVYVFANDATETHLAVLTQKFGVRRESIQQNYEAAVISRKDRKAEEARAMALIAPHMTPKEILSMAEDEVQDELLFGAYKPTHRSPMTAMPSLKVVNLSDFDEED